jgi:hypothetical protein
MELLLTFIGSCQRVAYRLIVVRAQSGLVRAEGKALKTGLFTGEGYGRSKYVREQLNEICEGHPECFATDSRFITSSMEGQFVIQLWP